MKRRAAVAAAVCAVAIVAVIVLGVVLKENVVYFRTVSEAVAEREDGGGDRRFRLAGAVVPGSVRETGRGVRFAVTEGGETVSVVHRGDPPDLFEGGAPVVCEGRWSEGAAFASDRILIRHGNEYRPPDVDPGRERS